MGVGRRSFLKLSGLALAGTLIDPLKAVSINNEYYVNRKFGILFEIPENWGFIHVKEFEDLKEKQILDGIYEAIKEDVYEDLGDPICIATKYFDDNPKYKGVFSPTITLNVTSKQELDAEGISTNIDELLKHSLLGIKNILKDFELKTVYPPYILNNHLIYERDSVYEFEHVELEQPLKVELKSFKIDHNNHFYEFNCR
jgi:hypothetical protein